MWIPVFSLDSFSGRYFGETVLLFVDANYGPVLAWARVTLERLLQEEAMRFPNLKLEIEVEGRNPSISRMSGTLASADRRAAGEDMAFHASPPERLSHPACTLHVACRSVRAAGAASPPTK